MKKVLFFLIFFLITAPFQVMAQQWQIDTIHTNFYFEVRHTYAMVRGQFTEFSGNVVFDPDKPEKSSFDFVIQVDSIDTKVGKRDTDLRSSNFFDAAQYPTITFKSTGVAKGADNVYLVNGDLTIKDVTRSVTLEFVYLGQKVNPLNNDQIVAGLDTTLTIDRLKFHVGNGGYYQKGIIGKEVNILLTMELLRKR